MSITSSSPVQRRSEPVAIGTGAAENLRYIRRTIEAAHTFTTVSGKGCIAMGLVAILAAGLEVQPRLAAHWLGIWIVAAVLACTIALLFTAAKARAQGLSLRRMVARRFFMTLAPAFVAGAVLSVALIGVASREVIAGTWLLLYGAGIAASGVFSIRAIWTAGLLFMALGTVTLVLPAGSAPLVLALGFGGIHVVLGGILRRDYGG